MLSLVASGTFSSAYYRLPDSDHTSDVLAWLHEQQGKVERVQAYYGSKQDSQKAVKALRDKVQLEQCIEHLEADPANYVIYFTEERRHRVLNVAPVQPPKSLIQRVLGEGRVVLLSGTLSRLDVALLAPGEAFSYVDMPSPIPAAQRQVLYKPFTPTSDAALMAHIEDLHHTYGGPTIVHVTYALGERLGKISPNALRNTPDNKESTIRTFKQQGGLFLASGCAEGLDLSDNLCRLNIIPVLPRPYIGDPTVKKWLAQPGGSKRYDMETLRTFQQQVGRSTRHVNDYSTTIVCDPRLPQLISKNRQDISDSLHSSISWTGKPLRR